MKKIKDSNPTRTGAKKTTRQIERIARGAFDASQAAGRKYEGSGFTAKWDSPPFAPSRQHAWIAGVKYVMKRCLSPRKKSTRAPKRKQ